ncbi:MAG TPA: SWIM zinc finger family protein [Pirellulaceae bacterium]|nr:SWIM zinc finger family protein [Pirellulaceae bacterium]
MIKIDEAFIEAAAPNGDAAKNGRGLVLKNKFVALHHSQDETLFFGRCQGSGKEPYLCSADFAVPEAAVYRCNCPSRQFPCKHSLGLLYAYVQGKKFTPADIPEELASKREKTAARVEKKKEEAEKPRTVNKGALAKKIKAQLEGIDLLQKLTLDLVRLGIGNMNAKSAREVEEQAKQLGNAYLPGAQAALHNYTKLFYSSDGEERSAKERESIYSEALDHLGRLHTLVKQGRAYLTRRLEDPELSPETDTSIAAWLGHAWQLRELKDAGLVQNDVELVQLAFNSHDDVARKEFVDTGIWMNLAGGRIQITQNFRPYKAVKYIKSDDSFFQVAQVKELCVYPGDVNPRIRWEGMLPRPLEPRDLEKIRSLGQSDFAAVVKEVKSHLKLPLADKQPIYALNFRQIGQVGDTYVVEDAKGERLALTDTGMTEEPASCHLLPLLPREVFTDQTLIARFRHDLDSRQLRVKPLSIVMRSAVIRLTM